MPALLALFLVALLSGNAAAQTPRSGQVSELKQGERKWVTLPGCYVEDEEVALPLHLVRCLGKRTQRLCDALDAEDKDKRTNWLTGES